MHSTKKFLLIAFQFLICTTTSIVVKAQITGVGNPYLYAPAPKTPEAAVLLQNAKVNDELYTGQANPSINLYIFQNAVIDIPIALTYTGGGGIKVSQIATNVGLGWSLSTNAMIATDVKGMPDFEPIGFSGESYMNGYTSVGSTTFPNPDNQIDIIGYFSNGVLEPDNLGWYHYLSGVFPNLDSITDFANKMNSGQDYEADIYSISAPNINAHFIFSPNREVLLLDKKPLKIEIIITEQERLLGFKVTDMTTGIIYIFKNADAIISGFTPNGTQGTLVKNKFTPSSQNWHISQIIKPGVDTLEYVYDYNLYSYISGRNFAQSFIHKDSDCTGGNAISYETKTIISSGISLRMIHSSKGDSIIFKYNSIPRLDLPNAKHIESISIYKNGIELKKISLYQSYFQSFHNRSDWEPEYVSYRLKLDSVKVTGENSYSFEYENAISIPKTTSYAQDRYGYYNGQISNTTLLPISTDAQGQPVDWQTAFKNPSTAYHANRRTYAAFTGFAILKKIKYPTGSKLCLEYEQNQIYTKVPRIVTTTYGIATAVRYATDPYAYFYPATDTFMLTDQSPTFDKIRILTYLPQMQAGTKGEEGYGNITLKNLTDNIQEFYSIMPQFNEQQIGLSKNKTYVLYTRLLNGPESAFAMANISGSTSTTVYDNVLQNVGGLRIKEIYELNPDTSNYRRFNYLDWKQVLIPVFTTLNISIGCFRCSQGNSPTNTLCYSTFFSSNSNTETAYPSHVVYPRVKIIFGKTGEYGYSIQNFNHADGSQGNFHVNSLVNKSLGLLLSDSTFERTSGTFILKSITRNLYRTYATYNPIGDAHWENATPIVPFVPVSFPNLRAKLISVGGIFFTYDPGYYENGTDWVRKVAEVRTEFFDGPSGERLSRSDTTLYRYDNAEHTLPTVVRSSSSIAPGAATYQVSFFNSDYKAFWNTPTATALQPLRALYEKGRVAEPVEQHSFVRLTNGQAYGLDGWRFGYSTVTRPDTTLQLLTTADRWQSPQELLPNPQSLLTPSLARLEATTGYERKVSSVTYSRWLKPEHIQLTDGPSKQFRWSADGTDLMAAYVGPSPTNWLFWGAEVEETTPSFFNATSSYAFVNGGFSGNRSVQGQFNSNTLPQARYVIECWARGTGTLNLGTTQNLSADWKLYRYVSPPTTQLQFSTLGDAQIDDLRIYPIDGQMQFFGYNERGLLSLIGQPNGVFNRYTYDEAARLQAISDPFANVLKAIFYHYKP